MLKKFMLITTFGVAVFSATGAYAHGHEEPVYVCVEQAPPAELVEKIAIDAPSPHHIWIKGYWKWVGRWTWVRGQWIEKPHVEAEWIPGYWAKKPHRWVWVAGHWE